MKRRQEAEEQESPHDFPPFVFRRRYERATLLRHFAHVKMCVLGRRYLHRGLDRLDPQILGQPRLVLPNSRIIDSAASRSRKNSTTFSVWALTTP